ncbi:MAG: cadherin-like beta sandwich domain-containing protein, partial [Longicatena sp.]
MAIKKTIKKVLVMSCTILLMLSIVSINVKAVAFAVSASNNGNGTTTVTVSGNCAGGFAISAGDASSSVGKTTLDSNASVTLSTGAGTFTVTATGISVTDANYNLIDEGSSASTSVTVTNGVESNNTIPTTPTKEEPKKVEENKNKDKDSSLSALSISAGKLSPEFVSETKSYSVDLPVGITEVEVSATPKSAKASVSGTGKIALKPGANTIEVTCSAEDGSTSAYVIKANVSEKPITTLVYGDKKLGVINGDVVLSKMFTKQKIKIDGKEVDAWNSETLKMTLIYTQDEKSGEKNLYIYDTKKNEVTSIYKPFAYAGKNLVQIDVPKELQEREGMKFTTVKLGQYDLPGWKFEDKHFQDYALIYVMDEAGKTQYYQYYQKDDNLQLYSGAATVTQEYYEKIEKERNMMFIGVVVLGVISLILLIIVILLFVKRRKTTKYEKVNMREQGFYKDLDVETQVLSQKN